MTVDIIHLAPGEQHNDEFWMLIEPYETWGYLATGAGSLPDGTNVYYSESGTDFERVLDAARSWCLTRNITRLYLQNEV